MTNLPWIILFTPLISAALIVLFTRASRSVSSAISILACGISFIASLLIFFGAETGTTATLRWITTPDFQIHFNVIIDSFSKTMLLVVTGVGLLIHIYSLGYMKDDSGRSRYFAALSFFIFSMVGITLADNFVMMFIFWELVGFSSYLLIGHWYERPAAAEASKKAFLVNRVGDFGFMLGILMLWLAAGTFIFADLPAGLKASAVSPLYLTIATLLVFCGAVGKSAQFPLHVWLPDAMEGPTPVSALIHAATMVAAGVYMLVRVMFLLELTPAAQSVIAWIGIATAVMAALMATQQNDIKRILAYSTLSQLGYMVMAAGLTAGAAAMFHLFTHAFFKALLFLGSGSIIYGLHHEQNIWKMGNLKNKLPATFLTFSIATLALTGFPYLFSGFYSKDAILVAAYGANTWMFWLGIFTAFLTSFYMFRLYFVVFFGKPLSEAAKQGHESPAVMTVPLWILAIFSVIAGFPFFIHHFFDVPHENIPILVPIVAISVFVLGFILALALYRNREKDPISIPFFANRFYIDNLYDWIVATIQGGIGSILAWIDRWVIDGLCVRGLSGLTYGVGYVFRTLQTGNLQAYAFFFGLGIVAVLYYVLF